MQALLRWAGRQARLYPEEDPQLQLLCDAVEEAPVDMKKAARTLTLCAGIDPNFQARRNSDSASPCCKLPAILNELPLLQVLGPCWYNSVPRSRDKGPFGAADRPHA